MNYDSKDNDDFETPRGSDDEFVVDASRRRGRLVGNNTDFKSIKWVVGQRFTCRDNFKNVVAKYELLQRRNVSITFNIYKRNQK